MASPIATARSCWRSSRSSLISAYWFLLLAPKRQEATAIKRPADAGPGPARRRRQRLAALGAPSALRRRLRDRHPPRQVDPDRGRHAQPAGAARPRRARHRHQVPDVKAGDRTAAPVVAPAPAAAPPAVPRARRPRAAPAAERRRSGRPVDRRCCEQRQRFFAAAGGAPATGTTAAGTTGAGAPASRTSRSTSSSTAASSTSPTSSIA